MQSIHTLPFKSLAVALLFTVFLGPVGLLYASFIGGIIMILVGIVVISAGYPFPIILVWLICAAWSVKAVELYNRRLLSFVLEKV